VPRLCRLVPGSRRVFTAPRLSPGTARPSFRRLFTSRSDGRTPLVDFCNLPTIHEHDRRTARTPHTALQVAPGRSSIALLPCGIQARTGGSPKRASREFTGQGPSEERERSSIPAPLVAIARQESFAPTRSARTPPVA
jgi:hypothetical protein